MQRVGVRRYSWLLALLLIGSAHAKEEETLAQRNPETGLESWKTTKLGVTLELTQLTPDQARAFFLGRGFESAEAEYYAAACVFMTILRNESAPAAISYNLAEWRAISANGRIAPLRLKEDWLKEWEARKLPQSSKIAFEWSQLPSEQNFDPGDWNQGMTTFALPHGSRFDLKFRWTVLGKRQESIMKGVICANDASGN